MLTCIQKISITLFALLLFSVHVVLASEVLINPPLIDVEVAPRDVITKEVTLKNETDHKLEVYATVNEIAVDQDGSVKEFVSPVMTDQTNTITSWIEVTRGQIEIEPKGTVVIPVTLRVHPYAKPGIYHAFVGFVPGPNRPFAESTAIKGDANGVIVKAVMQEKKNELLRITSFLVDRFVFLHSHRDITLEVENNGDSASVAKGEIIFYNSRGEEVASAKVNDEGATISPKERKTFTVEIPFADKIGRFKANVKLDYGDNKKSSVFDTTQFFMLPTAVLIGAGAGIILLSVMITYLLRRAFYAELHDEDDGNLLPLYVRNDREHDTKDHDIYIAKGE